MSFKHQVAYNATVQVAGKALVTIFSVFVTILLTRYLGPVGYGHYNTIITFVGFFVILGDLGVYSILVREMSQHPEQREKIYGNVFSYRVLSGFVTMMLAFLIALFLPYPEVVKFGIGIFAIASFISLVVGIVMAVFQINYRMDLPTVTEVLTRALYLLLAFLAIKQRYSLYGIFWLLVLTMFLNLLLNLFLSRRYIKLKLAFDISFIREFLKESLPMGIVAILGTIHFKIDTILLSFLKTSFDVGIYGASYRIFENLIIIPYIFIGLMFPKFSELYIHDKELLKNTFQKTIDVLILLFIPVTVLFFITAPYLIQVVAGGKFSQSVIPLRILLISLPFTFLIAPFSYLLIASKKQKKLIYVWSIASVLNIVLNLIFIPYFSYKGAASVTVLTEAISLIILMYLALTQVNIRPIFGYLKRVALPAILLILSMWEVLKIPSLSYERFINYSLLIQLIQSIFILALGGILYILFLLVFKVISTDALKDLIKYRGRQ